VHVLPRPVFRPLREIFESRMVRERTRGDDTPTRLADWIRAAWETGDAWMRACAVRASWVVIEADRTWFAGGESSAMVDAELAARFPDFPPAGAAARLAGGAAPC